MRRGVLIGLALFDLHVVVFDDSGKLIDHIFLLLLLEDHACECCPLFELGADSTEKVLFALIELAAQNDLSEPHVETELFHVTVQGHSVYEFKLIVPLREVLDEAGELIALLMALLLRGGEHTWY